MPFALPPFLRRMLALRRARRAVLAGDSGGALEILRDPALSLSDSARDLRERALENLCRAAGRALGEGDLEAARRALGVVSREDPARALEWDRRVLVDGHAPAADRSSVTEKPLVRLLSEMRAHRLAAPSSSRAGETERAFALVPSHNGPAANVPRAPEPMSSARALETLPVRFHFEVDDGGEFLAVSSDRIVLGHLRSAADLRFLADVEAEHVRLVRCESFHAGPSWQVERALARDVRINGRALEGASIGLFDGDEVHLARNLSFRFRQPEASSHSAVLELLGGAECEGALKVLLLAPGEAGVVRIGSKRNRHIPVADLEHEVSLKLSGNELWVHCAGGVRRTDNARASADEAGSSDTLIVACPPDAPQHLSLRARVRGRAPLGISLRPAPHRKEGA